MLQPPPPYSFFFPRVRENTTTCMYMYIIMYIVEWIYAIGILYFVKLNFNQVSLLVVCTSCGQNKILDRCFRFERHACICNINDRFWFITFDKIIGNYTTCSSISRNEICWLSCTCECMCTCNIPPSPFFGKFSPLSQFKHMYSIYITNIWYMYAYICYHYHSKF